MVWAQGDLNPRPTGYEPVALTRLSYGPDKLFRYENMYKGFEMESGLELELIILAGSLRYYINYMDSRISRIRRLTASFAIEGI
jgi:hypothetical protein